MRRREFVTGFAGSMMALPLPAAAQQARTRRIVFMAATAESDPQSSGWIVGFERRLEESGWIKGRNIEIEYRWGAGNVELVAAQAAEVAKQAPDVILALGTTVVTAVKRATSSIPIVFAVVNDPVAQGIVPSMAHPGGNITGFSLMDFSVLGKSMELLKRVAPAVTRMALLFSPVTYPYYQTYLKSDDVRSASSFEVVGVPVRSSAEIEPALGKLTGFGLVVVPDAFANVNRARIIKSAAENRIPATYPYRQFVLDGGLMTYGPDPADIVRRSAAYVDRILKGSKPAELPVQGATKFEFIVNLKTAKTLGLEVPSTLLFTADEVIE
jgi:putative tryptophan/tyrosine transport system substrate-binding protein